MKYILIWFLHINSTQLFLIKSLHNFLLEIIRVACCIIWKLQLFSLSMRKKCLGEHLNWFWLVSKLRSQNAPPIPHYSWRHSFTNAHYYIHGDDDSFFTKLNLCLNNTGGREHKFITSQKILSGLIVACASLLIPSWIRVSCLHGNFWWAMGDPKYFNF